MPKFLIGNYQTGLETDVRPWLLPKDAFAQLDDAYVFRGRVIRRPGYFFLGRLVDENDVIMTEPVMGLGLRERTSPNVINNEELIAFNQTKASRFDIVTSLFIDTTRYLNTGAGGTIFSWSSSTSQFFWTTSYKKGFFATNNKPGFHPLTTADAAGEGDGIRWYGENNLGGFDPGWANFCPILEKTNNTRLMASLIILPYKDRLLCLNTFEGVGPTATDGVRFPQRARWSQNGTPYYEAPVPTNLVSNISAWESVETGKGGFVDAPTNEQITSTALLKDSLIVFFERSTWRLAYSNNENEPFYWERINTELGSESTFSSIIFDNTVLTIGDKGIIGANQNKVERIDEQIPDDIFKIQNQNQGPQRTHGVRDFKRELSYWTYPASDAPQEYTPRTFPNRLFVYNYRSNNWSMWSGQFTTLGLFYKDKDDSWATTTILWQDAQYSWTSGAIQSRFPEVIGGNQQGFVHIIDNKNVVDNIFFLTSVIVGVKTVVTCPNHNLQLGAVVELDGLVGGTMSNLDGTRAEIDQIIDVDTFRLDFDSSAETGPATAGFVKIVPGFNILTKRFNDFISEDQSVDIPYVDFYLQTTDGGEISIDIYTDQSSEIPMPNLFVNSSTDRFTYSPTHTLSTQKADTFQKEGAPDRIWVRLYSNTSGQFIQFRLYLSVDEKIDKRIQGADLQLNAMMLTAMPYGRLI